MATNNTPQQEEVDLGKLFQIIGNGFKKLFNAISNLIKQVFHHFILLLIFFKKQAIILGVATLLGGVLGYILDLNKKIAYKSNMIVETNFGSGYRLYTQVDYLNTLISEKDTITLGKIFNIKSSEASKLSSFNTKPYDKEKNLKIQYDEYMRNTDTIYTQNFELTDFEERLSDQDYRFQDITAFASTTKIFNNLKNGIVNLVENDYLKNRYNFKKIELEKRKNIIENDLIVIDSLRVLYKKIALLNAKNIHHTPNTNIDLGIGDKTAIKNRDIELFRENNNLVYSLKVINREIIRSNFILDVISDFNPGKEYNSIKNKKWFKYAVLGFLITLLIILGLKVNTYLSNYEKSI